MSLKTILTSGHVFQQPWILHERSTASLSLQHAHFRHWAVFPGCQISVNIGLQGRGSWSANTATYWEHSALILLQPQQSRSEHSPGLQNLHFKWGHHGLPWPRVQCLQRAGPAAVRTSSGGTPIQTMKGIVRRRGKCFIFNTSLQIIFRNWCLCFARCNCLWSLPQ